MTISSAINGALSGLKAASRATQVVSSNLANATTPGYGVRELAQSASRLGGVTVDGVVRNSDPQLLSDRRAAQAEYGNKSTLNTFLNRMETSFGTPDEAGSLSAMIADFEGALITASSRPEATERLSTTADAARDLANGLNNASRDIQTARSQADREIGMQVDQLNASLEQVRSLNVKIASFTVNGQDTSALIDQRQNAIDEINEIVPLQILPRDVGGVALYSKGGALLLDGKAATLEFESVQQVSPYMTIEGGALSGLSINGVSVDVSVDRSPLRGGTLAAQFEIRDSLGVEAQKQLDAVARDLIERFQDPAVDPTLAPGDPGLFTDLGNAFDPLDEAGIASRISLNALADPHQGGETWRLRDGLGAAAPGDEGDARILQAFGDALNTQRSPSSGDFGPGSFSFSELNATMNSLLTSKRLNSDKKLSFASTQLNELREREAELGVDSDAEIQRLVLIENAYAANARVIEAANEMLGQLLSIR
ncbi:MAG: flagellar hook-associated protein FlgK [Pseudomonadota bacterium]